MPVLKRRQNTILSPALDDIGLSALFGLEYLTLDPHSGRKKKTLLVFPLISSCKIFLEGQVVGGESRH